MGSFNDEWKATNSLARWRERQQRALDVPHSESADAKMATGKRRYVSGLDTPNIPDA